MGTHLLILVSVENIKPGETYYRKLLMSLGSLSNVAIEISKLGDKVRFLGKVGRSLWKIFRAGFEGKPSGRLALIDPELPTGLRVCLAYQNGERTMIASRGASDNMTMEDVEQHIDRIKSSKLAYLSGYSLLREKTRKVIFILYEGMPQCRSQDTFQPRCS